MEILTERLIQSVNMGIAIAQKQFQAVEQLLIAHTDYQQSRDTAVYYAAASQDHTVLKLVLQNCGGNLDVNSFNSNGDTPLHCAVR
ncbi:hypothetical protein Pelo_9271 [Pelomyxa schiedti]|nr:hypothetical protein Pelo_9271 [Pelomyxa schiedti]